MDFSAVTSFPCTLHLSSPVVSLISIPAPPNTRRHEKILINFSRAIIQGGFDYRLNAFTR